MTESQWTIVKLLKWAADYFKEKGVSEPRASAEVLLAHALGLSRLDLYLRYDQPLSTEELASFKALVVRRREGEPVAYLTGHKEFWSLDFLVTPAVLIPRPETEILVQTAIEAAKDFIDSQSQLMTTEAKQEMPLWGAEIGVGSGAVVVSLAKELPEFAWLAVDLAAAALAVARENTQRHKVAQRVHFMQGDLLAAIKPGAGFALVVANLPYVPQRVWERLPRDIKDFEPKGALVGGEEGVRLIRRLAGEVHCYLRPGGWLALEVGEGQAERVLEMLGETGEYEKLATLADYQGIQRVVRGRRVTT